MISRKLFLKSSRREKKGQRSGPGQESENLFRAYSRGRTSNLRGCVPCPIGVGDTDY